jgi:DNA invertase Pin-like site-specific DNA recombinase
MSAINVSPGGAMTSSANFKIGYARVSTGLQDESLQVDALQRTGADRILVDRVSGTVDDRPGLRSALECARAGDSLVVWRLDRLGRSLRHLIDVVRDLEARGLALISLTEQLDTSTPGGRLVFHVFGAMAEFERDLIRERTRAGLDAARARGKRGGRPRKLDEKKKTQALTLHDDKTNTIADICRTLRVGRTTLYRYLAEGRTDARQLPE